MMEFERTCRKLACAASAPAAEQEHRSLFHSAPNLNDARIAVRRRGDVPSTMAGRTEEITLRRLRDPALAGGAAIADLKRFRRSVPMMKFERSEGAVITAPLAASATHRNELRLDKPALSLLVPVHARALSTTTNRR
jgi:hypothetical protein